MGGTGSESLTSDGKEAASLLDWWLAAGVDIAVAETPRDWLRARTVASVKIAAIEAPASADTTTLAAFQAWLGSAPGLPLEHLGAGRILPVGGESAPVMVLADLPGSDEAANGQPLAGEAWALAQRMLGAIGIDPADAYIASLACFHAPGARLTNDELERCAGTQFDPGVVTALAEELELVAAHEPMAAALAS